jgi:Fe-Mn family superoxide dismutase
MTIALPPLPYEHHALEPVISSATLKLHHGAHHRGYVDKLNALVKGSALAHATLEEIVKHSRGAVFNNAAQAWNHTFFWPLVSQTRSSRSAAGLFASGWVWLVEDAGILKVVTTTNAETPIVRGQKPLLVIDLWEHAYYLDHQNRRDFYVTGVVDHLLDWEFAERNLLQEETNHAE